MGCEVNRMLFVAMAGAAALLLMPKPVADEDADDEPNYEPPTLFDEVSGEAQEAIDKVGDMVTDALQTIDANAGWDLVDNNADKNLQAFMWMLRVSEGTSGPNGYRTIVGGSLFNDYSAHPNTKIWLPNLGIYSSAAGAYQFIRRTWYGVQQKLGLPDFSPASQDLACIELIRQRGALADVKAGRFAAAVEKCKKEWASLPGAGYGQHENTLSRLTSAYKTAGGYIA